MFENFKQLIDTGKETIVTGGAVRILEFEDQIIMCFIKGGGKNGHEHQANQLSDNFERPTEKNQGTGSVEPGGTCPKPMDAGT